MWFPKTAQELSDAISNGVLPHEATSLDYKRQPPVAAKNVEMAIDVAAMSTDGGVLIVGVAEDRTAKTFSPTPFSLVGFKERISQVVDSHVREPIEFAVHELQLDTDATQGFAAVVVPASLRAPHMVETTGQYYGRQPGGNRVLGEADVARLYERRQRAEDAALRALDEAIALAPIDPEAGRADLYLVALPLVSDSGLRERAMAGEGDPPLVQDVHRACSALRFQDAWNPNFADIISGGIPSATIDGIALLNPPIQHADEERIDTYVSRLELADNGTIRYFHAALGDLARHDEFILRDNALAQTTAHFCKLAGTILERGDCFGTVEVLIAVLGAGGATSGQWLNGSYFHRPSGRQVVTTNNYRNHERVLASKLQDDPIDVAQSLVLKLLRTIRPQGFPDPLALA